MTKDQLNGCPEAKGRDAHNNLHRGGRGTALTELGTLPTGPMAFPPRFDGASIPESWAKAIDRRRPTQPLRYTPELQRAIDECMAAHEARRPVKPLSISEAWSARPWSINPRLLLAILVVAIILRVVVAARDVYGKSRFIFEEYGNRIEESVD